MVSDLLQAEANSTTLVTVRGIAATQPMSASNSRQLCRAESNDHMGFWLPLVEASIRVSGKTRE